MSLGFTLSLGRDGGVYWPGSAFAMIRHHREANCKYYLYLSHQETEISRSRSE
jgi:hypothetical protein